VSPSLFERASAELSRARDGDGFGATPGSPPEPEPTALAAIALDDEAARRWLAGAQREDGSFGFRLADVDSAAATPLCALALPAGAARERALDHVVTHRAQTLRSDQAVPHDPSVAGWAWTLGTAGWVEPTASALLALRRLRPAASEAIADGVGYLRDRECVGGGWNYGNRVVLEEALPPFGQTTAMALIGLHGGSATDLIDRGVAALRRLWPAERGPLTLATSLAAFRLLGLPDADDVGSELADLLEREPTEDVVALAWAAIASGPGLAELAVAT